MKFAPHTLSPAEACLQNDVRTFLETELPRGSFRPGLGMSSPADPAFSKKLAARGWLGMALPIEYGGGARTAVDRFLVTEELLRWGAPVGHHWVADRQSGPVINKFGTGAQKQRFLPGICSGELAFSIGMSEPDAGSDLAAIRTRAVKVDGGWHVSGTKIWTTLAHRNDWLITLCRTSIESERRAGLTQLLVDLRGDGVVVRPITFLDGSANFSEVVLTDAFVGDDLVLGTVGEGWAQNTSELAYERGGPDRWLSSYLVVEQFLREHAQDLDAAALEVLGEATARWWGLRQLSLSVARSIDEGGTPSSSAALVKEMGSRFEQDVVAAVGRLVDIEPSLATLSLFERLYAEAVLTSPAFTIRGGTIEILRSVIARGLKR